MFRKENVAPSLEFLVIQIHQHIFCDKEILIEEWSSGRYRRLSDCPSYDYFKSYCDSYNALVTYLYNEDAKYYKLAPTKLVGATEKVV